MDKPVDQRDIGEPIRCPRCGMYYVWRGSYVEHAWKEQ